MTAPYAIVVTVAQMDAATRTPGRYRVHMPGATAADLARAGFLIREAVEGNGLRCRLSRMGDVLYVEVEGECARCHQPATVVTFLEGGRDPLALCEDCETWFAITGRQHLNGEQP